MCMFCFPASAVIPLHDHPGMTVLSKVLYGTLHVKAYDWVEPGCLRKIEGNDNSSVTVRLAKLAVDTVLMVPCKTSVLYPRSGGNLHIFTAATPCAVLDIIGFSSSDRRGSYYRDYPCSILPDETVVGKDEEGYAWLAEIDAPAEMYNVASRNYTGPAIQK